MPAGSNDDLARLIAALQGVDKRSRPLIRAAVRQAGDGAVRAAKSNASWSSRIPAAIRLNTSFSQRNPGVRLVVSSRRAPHGRPYEGITGSRSFRHPVFGRPNRTRRQWRWVSQPTRPFLLPAITKAREPTRRAIAEAIEKAARDSGFR